MTYVNKDNVFIKERLNRKDGEIQLLKENDKKKDDALAVLWDSSNETN